MKSRNSTVDQRLASATDNLQQVEGLLVQAEAETGQVPAEYRAHVRAATAAAFEAGQRLQRYDSTPVSIPAFLNGQPNLGQGLREHVQELQRVDEQRQDIAAMVRNVTERHSREMRRAA